MGQPQAENNATLSFETAFARLEEILHQMNNNQQLSLEKALALYEEADALIAACNARLSEAEAKVEVLMKNRQGELVLGPDQKPQTQEFSPPKGASPHE